MCRFLAYQGEPVFLESLVSKPCHSLIHQSIQATESKTVTNGDGFGLGWYGDKAEPGLYRDLRPAWSDENLLSLCEQVRSKLFFAHVRAATGTATSRANCHPFTHGRTMFMHNGQIGDYAKVRRGIEALIPDDLYAARTGTTDSEALFLAALARGAEKDAVVAFSSVLSDVHAMMRAAAIDEALRFAAAFTDGEVLSVFRWACDEKAPTLYWRQDSQGLFIGSEPLDDDHERWNAIPQGYALVARKGEKAKLRQIEIGCA